MECTWTKMVVGSDPAVGDKSQEAASPTVTQEKGPTEQPKFIVMKNSPIAIPEKGALTGSVL